MNDNGHLGRWAEILGAYEIAIKVAAIYGVDRSTVARWNERGWPLMATHILDVVEAVPPDALPAPLRVQIEAQTYTKEGKIRAA